MNDETKKTAVRDRYSEIARSGSSCCGTSSCGDSRAEEISSLLGYTPEELAAVPEGANLGLGCGNPTALAGIKNGETVIDLGSGAGFDCFLAARRVGSEGRVIGVDMTHEMISRARSNAEKGGHTNVEFRLGEIEHLPVADGAADLIISNCVINLSTDKASVFSEAFRVLKPGGRLAVSDIVLDGDLPDAVRNDAAAYSGCISGAVERSSYIKMMKDAGFDHIRIESESPFSEDRIVKNGDDEVVLPEGVVTSISVTAVKP
jgi:SAM-dependent methyltransferase